MSMYYKVVSTSGCWTNITVLPGVSEYYLSDTSLMSIKLEEKKMELHECLYAIGSVVELGFSGRKYYTEITGVRFTSNDTRYEVSLLKQTLNGYESFRMEVQQQDILRVIDVSK